MKYGENQTVDLDAEQFALQRAYLFALTIRNDVPAQVKEYIKKIETKLASLANVKSVFTEDPAVDQEAQP